MLEMEFKRVLCESSSHLVNLLLLLLSLFECFVSDKSTVEIPTERRNLNRIGLEKDHPNYLRAQLKSSTQVMIWSVISAMGTGRLEIVKSNRNECRDIIDRRHLLQLLEWFPDNSCIFMQDGAPDHTAKSGKVHYDNHGISVLDWLGFKSYKMFMEIHERRDKPSRI